MASQLTNPGITLVPQSVTVHTARMDSSPSTTSLSAQPVCSYPRCEDQRFAQNSFCLAHFQKMSWMINRTWRNTATWTGVAVAATVVLLLFL